MNCSIKSVLTQGQRTTVSVNGVVIAHDLISRETQNHPAANPVLAWTAATRALVVRELLLQDGKIGRCAGDEVGSVRRLGLEQGQRLGRDLQRGNGSAEIFVRSVGNAHCIASICQVRRNRDQ